MYLSVLPKQSKLKIQLLAFWLFLELSVVSHSQHKQIEFAQLSRKQVCCQTSSVVVMVLLIGPLVCVDSQESKLYLWFDLIIGVVRYVTCKA